MSKDKILIIEDSYNFKKGTILEAEKVENGFIIEEKYIAKSHSLSLNEALTHQDEEKVRQLCREILQRMFYRIYTRSSFIIK